MPFATNFLDSIIRHSSHKRAAINPSIVAAPPSTIMDCISFSKHQLRIPSSISVFVSATQFRFSFILLMLLLKITVFASSFNTSACSFILLLGSMTNRIGLLPVHFLVVSKGLSSSTVFLPTSMACSSARQRCASC